ncbi:MAG: mitochondrial fission ELM1 family protein [Rhodospirillales bacterium]|nr:mitochondrial fission ELM1 family protein [Rhodospirillales bacterium]MBO6786913.1 mitochondrial fission ELM1 family protein [Rhodospirillales bacterium]
MTAEGDIWVLLDDRAGNRSQALGVAERLALPFREMEIRYAMMARLPNVVLGASVSGLDASSKASLHAPWPKLVIAAGRRTAPVARWIKKQSSDTAKIVQIMDPGSGDASFDLICRPAHDGIAGAAPNVMTIPAAPHRMSADALARARNDWHAQVDGLPAPRIALLIGGSTRKHTFTPAMGHTLAQAASDAASALGGSLMVTTSRRTGDAIDAIQHELKAPHRLYHWDQGGENPYPGFLALADAVIVTGESVSMCSEAVATGKPVYIAAPAGLISAKHARLHDALCRGGHARIFDGRVQLDWTPQPLDVAAAIAAAIRERGFV